jgi:hypothetical protein
VADRNATARSIISLEAIAHAALAGRKQPELIERLQNEVLTLRARIRALNRAIKQQQSNAA